MLKFPESTEPYNLQGIQNADPAELKEFRDLAQSTRIGKYVTAAAEGRELREGAEFEYNKHVLNTWQVGEFPLEMLLGRDETIDMSPERFGEMRIPVNSDEHRTEITGVAATHGSPTWVDRLFADSEGAFVRATYPAVGPGRHSYPIVTGTGNLGAVIARTTAETVAGGLTVADADPERIQHSFEIAAVDELQMPGIANYLANDIRMALMAGLDNKVIDDLASGLGAAVLQTGGTTVTQATLFAAVASGIDGRKARNFNEINVLAQAATANNQTSFYEKAISFIGAADNSGAFNFFANIRASAHMAAPSGGLGTAILVGMAPSPPRLIVPVWRRAQLLRDAGRLQLQHAITLTGVMYADVILAATDLHDHISVDTQ